MFTVTINKHNEYEFNRLIQTDTLEKDLKNQVKIR
jgi:hypothetical protein